MAEWDPQPVTIGKKVTTKAGKSSQAINSAMRKGDSVDTKEKYGATSNKQSAPAKDTTKLDRETEELKHEKVSLEFSKLVTGFYICLFRRIVTGRVLSRSAAYA